VHHESIEDILASLSLKSSYWAMVISKFNKKEYIDKTFIVGIEFDNEDINFLYNMDNLKYIDINTIDLLLQHEVEHIFNNHYIRAIELQQNKKSENFFDDWNRATDIAINCNIENLPRSFWCGWEFHPLFPDTYGFEDGLMAEDYFEKFINQNNEDGDNNENNEQDNNDSTDGDRNSDEDDQSDKNESNENKENNNSESGKNKKSNSNNDNRSNSENNQRDDSFKEYDNYSEHSEKSNEISETSVTDIDSDCDSRIAQNNHEHWKANKKILQDPNSTYIAENIFRNVINDATVEYTKSFGNLPGDLQVQINDFLAPPKLPYYSIIKKLVVGSRLGKQKISYSKLNRKRMYVFTDDKCLGGDILPPFPGKKMDRSFKIGVLLDTSASVPITDDGIYEALNGLESILKEDRNAEIILLQVDTQIREEKTLKSIKDIHRLEIKGRGGTKLMPGLNRLKELKVDVSLVFTDGYFEDICTYVYALPKKIIWVMPEKGSTDHRIGKIGKIVYFPVK